MIQPPIKLYFPTVEGTSDTPACAAGGALARADRGNWIAVALGVVTAALLRLPGYGRIADDSAFHALNTWMSRLPFINFQAAIVDQDFAQLIIGAGAVALWYRTPADARVRTRILIAFTACFVALAAALLLPHVLHARSLPSAASALLAIAVMTAFVAGRRAGFVALGLSTYWCLIQIAFARQTLSDIAAGAAFGSLLLSIALLLRKRFRLSNRPTLKFAGAQSSLMAALGALALIEFSDGFHYLKYFVALIAQQRPVH